MRMPFIDAIKVINKGRQKENDERLWSQYVSIYPYMNKDNFITFAEFKNDCVAPKALVTSKADILDDVKGIIDMTL